VADVETGDVRGPIAIVLGLGVNGLGVVRSLGRRGVRCVGLVEDGRDPAVASRYLERVVVLGDREPGAALSELMDLAPEPPVLLPTSDRFALWVARNARGLRRRAHIPGPDEALCRAVLDKIAAVDLCHEHGMPTPASAAPSSAAAVSDACFPAILKPRDTWTIPFPGKNALAEDPAELARFFERHPECLGDVLVQRRVDSGDGHVLVAAAYVGRDGDVLGLYTGRKLRQHLPDRGVTCFGVSESLPEVERLTRRFLDRTGYRGFAALEFAEDRATGALSFLELNPRTYLHNQLFADAGVDLTWIGWRDLTGQPASPPPTQRDGLVWLDFDRDLRSFSRRLRAGRGRPLSWLWSLRRARSYAWWARDDPGPAARAAARLVASSPAAISRWRR